MNNYGIKTGYIPNTTTVTMDHVSGQAYWTADRVVTSRYYQFHVYEYAASLAKKIGAKTLVDVGCGVGQKLLYIHRHNPNLHITGIDQQGAIDFCKKNYDFGAWVVDDFENPAHLHDYKNPDIIICSDVIEHLDNPDNLLRYIKNIAGESTYIILSTPERDRMRGVHCMRSPNKQHIREWNMAEFYNYIKSHNFDVLEHFTMPQFKICLRLNFIKLFLKQLMSCRPIKNNQVAVLKKGEYK